MRKLAPFIFTTIAALAAGSAIAATNDMASPSVQPNTSNPNNLSYSDKSNTSPGTNAKMDDKNAVQTADPAVQKRNEKAARKKATMASKSNDGGMNSLPFGTSHGMTAKSTTGTTANAPMGDAASSSTGATANSLTGKSTGQ